MIPTGLSAETPGCWLTVLLTCEKRPVLLSYCLLRKQSGILYARGFATMVIRRSSSTAEHSPELDEDGNTGDTQAPKHVPHDAPDPMKDCKEQLSVPSAVNTDLTPSAALHWGICHCPSSLLLHSC